MGGRVKRVADRWYLCVNVDGEFGRPTTHINSIAGIDLGVKTAVVSSQQGSFVSPNPLKSALTRLKRAQRKMCRRVKGSKNQDKARVDVARIYQRVTNIRKDFMHKVTTRLVRENQTNVIEDLDVAGMLRNHGLARAVSDVGFGLFRQMMTYKAPLFGGETIIANRWFASSKTCHCCLEKNETLTLSDRSWTCRGCGVVHDRDENASIMLELYPGLWGTGEFKSRTPMDDHASTIPTLGKASKIVEVGTKTCSTSTT